MTQVLIAHERPEIILSFTKNREKIIALIEAGIFNIDSGKVEINIHNNQIQNIYTERMVYKRTALDRKN